MLFILTFETIAAIKKNGNILKKKIHYMARKNSKSAIEIISPPTSPYLWERRSDTSVQFWTKGSQEHSIIKPTVPPHLGLVRHDLAADISAPPPFSYSIFEKLGILHAAINEMKSGFRTYRYRQNFHFVIFVFGGEISLVSGKRKISAKKGDLLTIPAGSDYEIRTSKGWKTCWFHLKESKCWNGIVGNEIKIKKSMEPEKLLEAMKLCALEVHSPARSEWAISLCADIVCSYVRAELLSGNESPGKIELLENCFQSSPASIPSAQEAAKRLGVSVAELNKLCLKKFGATHSKRALKIKMAAAKSMLSRGDSIEKAAEASGYANRRSFGRAFLRECGITPRMFVKTKA